jgi:hypothetical protein
VAPRLQAEFPQNQFQLLSNLERRREPKRRQRPVTHAPALR